jgi:hypothetical protein
MKMIKLQYIALIAFCGVAVSCKKDNYSAPGSTLSGRIVYKGEAIGVEQYQVPYELYQFGFGKVGPIGSSFAQDGSYSAVLFDGEYKLIIPNDQGPFLWKKTAGGAPDSLNVSLRGSKTLDLEVTPYYMIRTPQLTAAGGKVNATFKAEKIITDANAKNIEFVALYINKTQFVSGDNNYNVGKTTIAGGSIADPNNIALNVSIPTFAPAQNYVFARVAIKIFNVEDLIFSPVQKITF